MDGTDSKLLGLLLTSIGNYLLGQHPIEMLVEKINEETRKRSVFKDDFINEINSCNQNIKKPNRKRKTNHLTKKKFRRKLRKARKGVAICNHGIYRCPECEKEEEDGGSNS